MNSGDILEKELADTAGALNWGCGSDRGSLSGVRHWEEMRMPSQVSGLSNWVGGFSLLLRQDIRFPLVKVRAQPRRDLFASPPACRQSDREPPLQARSKLNLDCEVIQPILQIWNDKLSAVSDSWSSPELRPTSLKT